MQEEIHILFPKQNHSMKDGTITFTINNMKCRTVAVIYYILHCYNFDGTEILVENKPFHIGERWAVDETWSSYHDSFEMLEEELSEIYQIQIELVLINVNDNNPLHFTDIMFQNDEFEMYHNVNEDLVEADIQFINNAYANLWGMDTENYLQVIRPNQNKFTTNKLTKDSLTVLAPHLFDEPSTDKPENIFVEFVYQTEQTTNIKPI